MFLPQRLHSITSLRVKFPCHEFLQSGASHLSINVTWAQVWEAVAVLPHLEQVQLTLSSTLGDGSVRYGSIRLDPNTESLVFEPLMHFSGSAQFEVRVAWEPHDLARFRNAPFSLSWRGPYGQWQSSEPV